MQASCTPIKVFVLSGSNEMHVMNYMHTKHFQRYQTVNFLNERTLEMFFQCWKLALDLWRKVLSPPLIVNL